MGSPLGPILANWPFSFENLLKIKTNFSIDPKELESFSFLEVKTCLKKNKLVTSAHEKPTFSGIFLKFYCYVPRKRTFIHITP